MANTYSSGQAGGAVRADVQSCLNMIREGRCTVEAAKDALDATLHACDEAISFIADTLDSVKEDLNANKYAQQYVEEQRRDVASRQADAACAAREAKQRGDEREAVSQQTIADALKERLRQINEDARMLERDQAALEREKETVQNQHDDAVRERDRLDQEGHDMYNRLVERTEAQNRELQRQADLISSK